MSERTSVSLHEMIDQAREDAAPLGVASEDARRYAVGDHNAVTAPGQRMAMGDRAARDQFENIIGQCVSQVSGRLLFRRFLVEDDAVNRFLEEFARRNQLERQMIGLTSRAQIDGSTAASVSWSSRGQRPVLHAELWWNGEDGMFVQRDDAGDIEWACKEWHDGTRLRRTVYEDAVIRKFQEDGGWREIETIVWTKNGEPDGVPIGVPVAHFPNGVAPFGAYPPSTVDQVISRQDALNGTLFDIMSASAFTGSQTLTATGVDPNTDRLEVGPGHMLKASGANASFGAIPAGNVAGLLDVSREIRSAIAAQFPVPSYRLGSGDWPSGIALQRSDAPMIAQVKLLGDVFAPSLVYLAHRATEMANTFARAGLNEDVLLRVEWAPPDQVDPGTQVEIDQAKVDLYASIERLTPTMMEKTGLVSPKDIAAILQARREADMLDAGTFASVPDDEGRAM